MFPNNGTLSGVLVRLDGSITGRSGTHRTNSWLLGTALGEVAWEQQFFESQVGGIPAVGGHHPPLPPPTALR